MITCWERTGLLALLCVVFSCVMPLSHTVSRVIVSIPDHCLPLYFYCDWLRSKQEQGTREVPQRRWIQISKKQSNDNKGDLVLGYINKQSAFNFAGTTERVINDIA